ncbi:MAG TPA: mechanosensitive ion channel family protein [Acidimicrobiales bacterium]|nr:mechanosensitive ion channel family protein [Acidimicrobiales bacterium]
MLLSASSRPVVIVPRGVTAWDWVHAGVILAVTLALCLVLRRAVGRIARVDTDRVVVRVIERILVYMVVVVGFLYSLGALRVQIGPLLGALGIGGIAVAFAMQDTLQNLVAGVILQARRPFRRGDQVKLDRYEGVVEDIDLRNVSLVTFDGLNVFLPNKAVLENPIVNYTRTPTRRTELEVGVAYGTDLARAQQVLVDAAARTPGIETAPAPAAWVKEFGESSVNFGVLVWHAIDGAGVWKVRSDLAMAVQAALDDAGVEIPFPQRVVRLHRNGAAPEEETDARGRVSRV